MSVTVKVQFGDKLFKLSPGITSLQQVDEEMRRRYPNKRTPLQYYFEGSIVQDLNALLNASQNSGKTSIKIVARSNADMSRLSEKSFIQIIASEKQNGAKVRKVENSVVLVEEKLLKVEPEAPKLPAIEYHMPKQFYVCYNCEGSGVYESSEVQHLCSICGGRGQFSNDHKYIQHMKKLFSTHAKPVELGAKIEEIKKPQFPRVFRGLSKIYEMNIRELNKIEKMEIGKDFTYQFQIHNVGKDLPENLEVVNCETKESVNVNTVRSGEKMVVEVGPFSCQNENLLEKAFYLCYRLENGWERLGYRFGFRVRGYKNVEVKKVESNGRDLIRNLKLLSGSRKSEDYISMKLRDMDIDINNHQIDDETLIEIVRNIK